MNMEEWGLNTRDAARAAAVLQPGEQVVLVVKPLVTLPPITRYLLVGMGLLLALWLLKDWDTQDDRWLLAAVVPLLLCAPWLYRWYRERTLYLLTNRRVVMLEPGLLFMSRHSSYPLHTGLVKEVVPGANGSGDIVFAYEPRWRFSHNQIRREIVPVGFMAVPQVERVEQMIAQQVATFVPTVAEPPPAAPGVPTLPTPPPVAPMPGPLDMPTDSWGNARPQEPGRGALIGFGVLFTLFSLAFAVFGGYKMYTDNRLETEGCHVVATVVKVNAKRRTTNHHRSHNHGTGVTIRLGDSRKDRSSYAYYPVFQFTDAQGTVHEYESTIGGTEYNYPRGHKVPVVYDPAEPSQVRPEGEGTSTGLVFTLAGSLLSIVGIGIFIGGLKKKK